MPTPDWRRYETVRIGTRHAAAFIAGVARNGGSRQRCPLCDGTNLHHQPDPDEVCTDPADGPVRQLLIVACHDCQVRWKAASDPEPSTVSPDPGQATTCSRTTRPGSKR